uniref:Uncharacterized protein n=1 Tax=Methylocapsa acidiphila TaxID=133552 RepID=Q2VNL3_METAI|nr:hypothetical protein orf62 [Methylocapsa acidiphila]
MAHRVFQLRRYRTESAARSDLTIGNSGSNFVASRCWTKGWIAGLDHRDLHPNFPLRREAM